MLAGFVGGGFECTTHIRGDGRRLDLVRGTRHDLYAAADYKALRSVGLGWARDGLRWHLVEALSGARLWDSWRPQLEAAREAGVVVWWDLIHFGLPGWCDVWSPAFPAQAAAFAAAAAQMQLAVTGRPGRFCPVNEISFLAFAAGQVGWFHPFGRERGVEMKEQLVRAAVAMSRAIRQVDPGALLLSAEPLIHVQSPDAAGAAEAAQHSAAQFEALDWIIGRARPDLGGEPGLVDLVGFNHYPHNQRMLDHALIGFGTPQYRPLSDLLQTCAARYPGVPIVLSETGAEGAARGPWLAYIEQEAEIARSRGIPLMGACLYPVTDYPGWDDDRHCPTGLFGLAVEGQRAVDPATERAVRRLQQAFDAPACSPVYSEGR